MRAIYKIARLELSNLFYSPVAWLLLVLFTFMSSMTFMEVIEQQAFQQELTTKKLYAVSETLFYSPFGGLWGSITNLFYMFMPLLTMGLISQEFNRGSIKLLFSAPISSSHIVFGKYLGIMMYGLLMIGILLIYVFIGGYFVESFDWPAVLTGLLGLYLLYGLYAAIGLFMSSLTFYQIVAAIGMLALLTLLRYISGVWQEYAFIREITYWLSLNSRAENFIGGMLCSEDVLYFVVLIGMFLGFSILKLQLCRERCSFWGRVSRYMGVFVVSMFLGYLTSRPIFRFYYDATHTKENTLTKASQDIVSRLDGGLKLTTYVNLFDDLYSITTKMVKNDIARYNRYIRFKPEMEFDYVFYYYADTTSESFKRNYPGKTLREAAKDYAKLKKTRFSKYLTPEELAEKIDLSEEGYHFVGLLERENGQKTFLRVFDDMQRLPMETEISAALKRIAMKLPRVGFLSDHQARSITGEKNRDYSLMVAGKTFRSSLLNQGFDVASVSLNQKQQILDSLDILVVSEPLESFTNEELEILYRYIDSGKNLILAGKPKTNLHLTPLMERFGLYFEPGVLVQQRIDEYPVHTFLCRVAEEAKGISLYWNMLYAQTNMGRWPKSLVMPAAAAIKQVEDKGFRVTPLLEGRDSITWNELETVDFVNDTAILNSKIGEIKEKKTTMMALERERDGRQQRIIVLGDADCFSMGELSNRRRGISSANGQLIMSMFDWLSYGELPVNTSRPRAIDNELHMGMEFASVLKNMLQWILPVVILIIGILVLFRRKGK